MECKASAAPNFKLQAVATAAVSKHAEISNAAVSKFASASSAPPLQDAQAQLPIVPLGALPVDVNGTDLSFALPPLSAAPEMIFASTENSAAVVSTRGSMAEEFQQNAISIEALYEQATALSLGSQAKATSPVW